MQAHTLQYRRSRFLQHAMAAGYIKSAEAALSKKFATYIPYYA